MHIYNLGVIFYIQFIAYLLYIFSYIVDEYYVSNSIKMKECNDVNLLLC